VFYRWIRDWHLYAGLFVSPFILLFSLSVLFLNHAKIDPNGWSDVGPPQGVRIPAGLDTAQGPAAIPLARDILSQVAGRGEIGFTRFVRKTRHFVFPVSRPGLEMNVDVDVDAGTAVVSRRRTGILEALAYLHKLPGPHNANIRGNWVVTRFWRVVADTTIYLTLFISVSGIYLWYVLKAERRVGLALLGAGVVSLSGILYAVIR
jgi:hypothetical protein